MNILRTVASAVILTLGWFSAVLAHCGVEFHFFFISMFLGTCLVNDSKTNFFSHAHSALQSDGKQKTVKSRQIRSKATLCRYALWWTQKKILYHQGRQDR